MRHDAKDRAALQDKLASMPELLPDGSVLPPLPAPACRGSERLPGKAERRRERLLGFIAKSRTTEELVRIARDGWMWARKFDEQTRRAKRWRYALTPRELLDLKLYLSRKELPDPAPVSVIAAAGGNLTLQVITGLSRRPSDPLPAIDVTPPSALSAPHAVAPALDGADLGPEAVESSLPR
jgi:hypothetical protein